MFGEFDEPADAVDPFGGVFPDIDLELQQRSQSPSQQSADQSEQGQREDAVPPEGFERSRSVGFGRRDHGFVHGRIHAVTRQGVLLLQPLIDLPGVQVVVGDGDLFGRLLGHGRRLRNLFRFVPVAEESEIHFPRDSKLSRQGRIRA